MNHNHTTSEEASIETELTQRLTIASPQDKQALKEYVGATLYGIATRCGVCVHTITNITFTQIVTRACQVGH